MALVALLEVVLLVGLGWLVLSQLVLPVIKGDPVLPMFWSMADSLEVEKEKLAQKLKEQEAEAEVEALRKRLLHKENRTESNDATPKQEKEEKTC